MDDVFSLKFNVDIGQPCFSGMPYGDAFATFSLNKIKHKNNYTISDLVEKKGELENSYSVVFKLTDLIKYFKDLEKGPNDEDAIKAISNIRGVFDEIFMKFNLESKFINREI